MVSSYASWDWCNAPLTRSSCLHRVICKCPGTWDTKVEAFLSMLSLQSVSIPPHRCGDESESVC